MKSDQDLLEDVRKALADSHRTESFFVSEVESSRGWFVSDADGEWVAYVASRELAEALVALFESMPEAG